MVDCGHEAAMTEQEIPNAFLWRRLHSLTGLFLVLFLFFHLMTNSQAALPFGTDGKGFIHGVNGIQDIPYLKAVEILLLAIPILIHAVWGIIYLRSAKYNSFGDSGANPYLPYGRNKAYTWQRITSWILLVLIAGHVVHMRFLEYPTKVMGPSNQEYYMVKVSNDTGLETVSHRLGVEIYNQSKIDQIKISNEASTPIELVQQKQEQDFLEALKKRDLGQNEVIAVSKNFGTAELMMLRQTFQSPLMIGLYTILVLSACFHAFNGLWTFMISWGVTLTPASQRGMLYLAYALMTLVAFFGLSAIFGTYWINLRQ